MLSQLLVPARRGSKIHLSASLETTIVDILLFAGKFGFTKDTDALVHCVATVAEEEGCDFKNGIQKYDWVRAFRAQQTDPISLRSNKSKDIYKLAAENEEHTSSFKKFSSRLLYVTRTSRLTPDWFGTCTRQLYRGSLGNRKKSSKSETAAMEALVHRKERALVST